MKPHRIPFFASFVLLLTGVSALHAQEVPAALDFEMKSIDGETVSLSKYSGKVVLLVNTASKCGHTPQYKQLQELHEDYASKGLAVIGVPCNQFRGQEPGTDQEIAEFCSAKYGVQFDMLSKVDVKGKQQCELYKYLTGLDLEPRGKGPVKWNFEKIVLDRSGKPIARFGSRVKPKSDEVLAVINEALESKQTANEAGGDQATSNASEPYSHVSQKNGKKYYLFKKVVPLKNSDKTSTIYWFAKNPTSDKGSPVTAVPEDRIVSETKTGMLVLKSKTKK